MRPVPPITAAFIKRHEGLVLRVYDDRYPKKVLKDGDIAEGTLTAGYGHTGGLKIGQRVTRTEAEKWLDEDLKTAARRLIEQIGGVANELTDNQYAAMISFVFNLGANPSWTIWKRIKARQFDQIPVEMMKFVNQTVLINGKKQKVKVSGLVKRRAAEVELWSTNEPGSIKSRPSSGETRESETPPTPLEPKPLHSDLSIQAGATAGVATGGTAVVETLGEFQNQLTDMAYYLDVAKYALLAILVISLGVMVWTRVQAHRRAKL